MERTPKPNQAQYESCGSAQECTAVLGNGPSEVQDSACTYGIWDSAQIYDPFDNLDVNFLTLAGKILDRMIDYAPGEVVLMQKPKDSPAFMHLCDVHRVPFKRHMSMQDVLYTMYIIVYEVSQSLLERESELFVLNDSRGNAIGASNYTLPKPVMRQFIIDASYGVISRRGKLYFIEPPAIFVEFRKFLHAHYNIMPFRGWWSSVQNVCRIKQTFAQSGFITRCYNATVGVVRDFIVEVVTSSLSDPAVQSSVKGIGKAATEGVLSPVTETIEWLEGILLKIISLPVSICSSLFEGITSCTEQVKNVIRYLLSEFKLESMYDKISNLVTKVIESARGVTVLQFVAFTVMVCYLAINGSKIVSYISTQFSKLLSIFMPNVIFAQGGESTTSMLPGMLGLLFMFGSTMRDCEYIISNLSKWSTYLRNLSFGSKTIYEVIVTLMKAAKEVFIPNEFAKISLDELLVVASSCITRCNMSGDDAEISIAKSIYQELHKRKPVVVDPYYNRIVKELSFIIYEKETRSGNVMKALRPDPVGVCLYGDPGVGKTIFINKYLAHLTMNYIEHSPVYQEKYYKNLTNMVDKLTATIYSLNLTDAFFSNYMNQPFAMIDDLLQNDTESATGDTSGILASCMGDQPYPLNMPGVEEKGRVFFNSLVVAASTNVEDIAPKNAHSPEAMYRRFPLHHKAVIRVPNAEVVDYWYNRLFVVQEENKSMPTFEEYLKENFEEFKSNNFVGLSLKRGLTVSTSKDLKYAKMFRALMAHYYPQQPLCYYWGAVMVFHPIYSASTRKITIDTAFITLYDYSVKFIAALNLSAARYVKAVQDCEKISGGIKPLGVFAQSGGLDDDIIVSKLKDFADVEIALRSAIISLGSRKIEPSGKFATAFRHIYVMNPNLCYLFFYRRHFEDYIRAGGFDEERFFTDLSKAAIEAKTIENFVEIMFAHFESTTYLFHCIKNAALDMWSYVLAFCENQTLMSILGFAIGYYGTTLICEFLKSWTVDAQIGDQHQPGVNTLTSTPNVESVSNGMEKAMYRMFQVLPNGNRVYAGIGTLISTGALLVPNHFVSSWKGDAYIERVSGDVRFVIKGGLSHLKKAFLSCDGKGLDACILDVSLHPFPVVHKSPALKKFWTKDDMTNAVLPNVKQGDANIRIVAKLFNSAGYSTISSFLDSRKLTLVSYANVQGGGHVYFSNYQATAGNCGSPIYRDNTIACNSPVMGIHCGSDTRGTSSIVPITQNILEDGLRQLGMSCTFIDLIGPGSKEFTTDVNSDIKSIFANMTEIGSMTSPNQSTKFVIVNAQNGYADEHTSNYAYFIGSALAQAGVNIHPKPKDGLPEDAQVPTKLFDYSKVCEDEKHQHTEECFRSPYKIAYALSTDRKGNDLPDPLLESVKRYMQRRYYKNSTQFDYKILSLDEAIDGFNSLEHINFDSSTGLQYGKIRKKGDLSATRQLVQSAIFRHDMEKFMESIRDPNRPVFRTPTKQFIKDELMKLRKYREGRMRVINAMTTQDKVLSRQILGSAVLYFNNNQIENTGGIANCINPIKDAPRMYDWLHFRDMPNLIIGPDEECFTDIDVKAQDVTSDRYLTLRVKHMLCDLFPSHRFLLRRYFDATTTSFNVASDTLQGFKQNNLFTVSDGGIASGEFTTSLINCLIAQLMFLSAIVYITKIDYQSDKEIDEVLDRVRVVVGGDDVVGSVHPTLLSQYSITIGDIISAYDKMGITATSGNKDAKNYSNPLFKKFEECVFLKRSYGFDGISFSAKLELASILKPLANIPREFVSFDGKKLTLIRSAKLDSHFAGIFRGMSLELSRYDISTYEKWTNAVYGILKPFSDIKLMSYVDARNQSESDVKLKEQGFFSWFN